MDNFNLIEAGDVKLETIDYYWHNRIPRGQIVICAGRQGGGKSTVVSDIAAHVTRDLGLGVILSNQEDALSVVSSRLKAAGADMRKTKLAAKDSGSSYLFPDDIDALRAHIVGTKAALAIFDTAAQHLGVPMGQDQAVRQALSPLRKVAEETGCTIMFLTHVTKHVSKSAHPLAAIGGSGGITGAARMAFFVGAVPADEDTGSMGQRACVWVKDQYREMPKAVTFEIEQFNILDDEDKIEATTQRLIFASDDADIDAMAVLSGKAATGDGTPRADKRAGAAEWLTIYLQGGKQPATDLRDAAALAGFAWATIRRAKDDVGIESYRVGFGKGSKLYWALPDGHPCLISDAEVEQDVEYTEDGKRIREAGFIGPLAENEVRAEGEVLSDEELTISDDDIAALLGGDDA